MYSGPFYDLSAEGMNTDALGASKWLGIPEAFTHIMGFSFFASIFQNSYIVNSVKFFLLGTLVETGRRLCQWLIERFRFQYAITAQFTEGDPAYDWVVLFLTQENVWRRSREFKVTAKSSKRQWSIKTGPTTHGLGNADFVPTYELPQLFRWKGYWLEIKRNNGVRVMTQAGSQSTATIFVTIYSLDMNVLSLLVEEARELYFEVSRPHVIVHTADSPSFGPAFTWNNVKRKARRPLTSIILQEGMISSLVKDAQEFFDMENWYIEVGIPHRRGYLLYGPPGTGKSSTIYALAGELNLEIFSLSLSSGFVDDSFLQRAASSMPKRAILLLEDIDCAFPSREEADDTDTDLPMYSGYPGIIPTMTRARRSAVTLSGLLNVIDGVGSEEGKLFFATTNYIERLDPALLRPGRIDKKFHYKLATKEQATALFLRFFPESRFPSESDNKVSSSSENWIRDLADKFGQAVPAYEFSTAELQGYLLMWKKQPEEAVSALSEWVEQERSDNKERREKEQARKNKAREVKEKRVANQLQGSLAHLGGLVNGGPLTPMSLVASPRPSALNSSSDGDARSQNGSDSPPVNSSPSSVDLGTDDDPLRAGSVK